MLEHTTDVIILIRQAGTSFDQEDVWPVKQEGCQQAVCQARTMSHSPEMTTGH